MEKVTLYKKAKTGKTQLWSAEVVAHAFENSALIIRTAGYIDGKITITNKVVRKGCNIGKKNEKTPYDLAVTQAEKYIKDHIEDNWHLSIDDIEKPIEFIKPMLAEPLDLKKLRFPCYAQPKMNGVRCFSLRHIGDETMWSRERREYSAISEIKEAVGRIFGNISPDGEIYNPDMIFEDITSAVKKRGINTPRLKMWIYDLAIPDVPFVERLGMITDLVNKFGVDFDKYFVQVPTIIVNSFEELDRLHDQFVADGFEGLMIRAIDGVYEFNERTFSLMKYKKFMDAEFPIVGFEKEVWHDTKNDVYRDLVMWKCQITPNIVTDVRPAGSFLLREEAYKTADQQIGKMYTVKFQNYSDEGDLIFPVGVAIRDYE